MLRLRTFGGLAVSHDERALGAAAAQPRRLALLAVLARSGERGVTRDQLLQLFWPDEEEERARRTLAQALYALRRDLGDDRVIVGTGTQELRLDPTVVASDVAEFTAHVRAGRLPEAAEVYVGPFLGGFHLVGTPEFKRWAEEERTALAREHARVLARLALAAERDGQVAEAAAHWQALAAVEPLDARTTVRLMEALEAAGDRAGALRQARIYEALVAQELELPPDRSVVALAERLRAAPLAASAPPATDGGASAVLPGARAGLAVDSPAVPGPSEPTSVTDASMAPSVAPLGPSVGPAAPAAAARPGGVVTLAPRHPAWHRRVLLGIGLAGVAIAGGLAVIGGAPGAGPPAPSPALARTPTPTLAVGLIRDFRGEEGAPVRSLAALLATNLARGEGLQVISAARVGEVQRALAVGDSTEAAFASAARQAGATELVDGALYAQPDGTLRLDLRRVALSTGAVRVALTVRGRDLFALADSGTAGLLGGLGLAGPAGSVTDVTTRSSRALALYADGLRARARDDQPDARRLFGAALREDPGFAMAAFEYARVNPDRARMADELSAAVRLADRATPRERLLIRAGWASVMVRAELRPLADSLLALDPDDLEALLYAAEARQWAEEWGSARSALERVVARDSLALQAPAGAPCAACAALRRLVGVAIEAGELDVAERQARRRTRLQPRTADAWGQLASALDLTGRHGAADSALGTAYAIDPQYWGGTTPRVIHLMRAGRFADAERVAREGVTRPDQTDPGQGYWVLADALRHQGRAREALAAAQRWRTLRGAAMGGRVPLNEAVVPALALAESGDRRGAIALLDSIAEGAIRPGEHPANATRLRPLALTKAAELRAAIGDTAGLAALADAVERAGAESGVRRQRVAHHYVRGLLLAARGDTARAIAQWRAALAAPWRVYHAGANLALAAALTRRGQADEAVAVARALLRATPDGLQVTLPEIHEALARAHDAAGRPDSATAHWRYVAAAWQSGDPPYAARAAAARARLAAGR